MNISISANTRQLASVKINETTVYGLIMTSK
jgi:hypothetical protein